MDRDEYVNFQHPEEADYMEEIAIDEIVDEVDKDLDRYELIGNKYLLFFSPFSFLFNLKYVFSRLISIDEFLGQYGDGQRPDWVEHEREHFAKTFDLNGNGKLERNEIHKWVIPSRGESREEAEHLMEGTDEDANGLLSVDEIILHFDLFVGSRATDHGETLKRMKHDEF